jgi:hypothetical protein
MQVLSVPSLGYTTIAYGMNADDTRDYRPGQRAAEEHAVLAPLADAGLTKTEIRALAKAAGYPLWDRPAAPCLSSRVEYGRTVTREVLSQVERAEESLRQLGFRELRVRHHGELARVEIARAELPRALAIDMLDAISAALKQAGFQYVTLDCTGFRSGSMNAILPVEVLCPARCLAESLESTSMRTAYLECFSGISGDMLLGALVDAGSSLRFACGNSRRTQRGREAGDAQGEPRRSRSQPKSTCITPEQHVPVLLTPMVDIQPTPTRLIGIFSAILKIIHAAALSESVKARATRAFQLLGEAEAAIHSIPIEKVHFHEVGAVDTIVDIVCAAAGAELLAVDRWLSSPLNVGSGTVVCQHGTIPVPAPATLALLADAPVYPPASPWSA